METSDHVEASWIIAALPQIWCRFPASPTGKWRRWAGSKKKPRYGGRSGLLGFRVGRNRGGTEGMVSSHRTSYGGCKRVDLTLRNYSGSRGGRLAWSSPTASGQGCGLG